MSVADGERLAQSSQQAARNGAVEGVQKFDVNGSVRGGRSRELRKRIEQN